MKTNTEIWEQCLGLIKKNTAEQAFETWFESINLLDISNKQATLQVPNRFHYEWIESKYGSLISSCMKKCVGEKIAINYSIVINNKDDDINSNVKKIDELIPSVFHRASQLNNRYIFKNFIEGKGNQFAKAAATSVADGPGQTPFNPLLIYSNPGLGKTHLIQAIGNHILKAHPNLKIMYITSEKFMLDFIQSIQNNKSTQFAKSYRKVDVLLVDDVQFFQTKEQTQEQFFHLFNDLFQQGKQIILTTDKHPNKLVHLKDRLVSRFQSGLIVDIQPPDFETRIAILMKKAENEKLDIPFDIIEFIAGAIKDDIRVMEGALLKLLALSSLKQADITISLAKEVITNLLGEMAFEQISLDQICKLVAGHFNVPEKKLYSKSRIASIVSARHVAMFLCRELTKNPLIFIGKHFGKRDHSTVIHACKVVEEKIINDKMMKKNINLLKKQLQ